MWKYTSIVVDLIFMLGAINNLLGKWKKTTYNGKVEETGMVFTGAIGTGTMDDLKDTLQSLIFALFNQEHTGMVDKYSTVIFPFLVVYFFLQRTTYIYIWSVWSMTLCHMTSATQPQYIMSCNKLISIHLEQGNQGCNGQSLSGSLLVPCDKG